MKHFDDGEKKYVSLLNERLESSQWRVQKEEGDVRVDELDEEHGFWLRVTATFPKDSLEELRDVLDVHLETRQREWHDLLLAGGGKRWGDGEREIFTFAYKSPWPFAPRSCLYCKKREQRDKKNGFVLYYWTVEDDALLSREDDEGRVRIDFQAAHVVEENKDGSALTYVYIQKSDGKVAMMPDFALKKIQGNILFQEVAGLRRTVVK